MSVRYLGPAATNTSLGCFTKLLFKWRGSVYKLVWVDYLVFITLYYVIFFIYRFCLNDEQQRLYEKISHYCEAANRPVEMSFVLGFFVTTIVKHWWQLYQLIPWPDSIAHYLNAMYSQNDTSSKLLRRTVLRYCNLTLALSFQTVSPSFKNQYPTLNHLVQKGLLLPNEKLILEKYNAQTNYGIQWLPISWATDLIVETKKPYETRLLEELNQFRRRCSRLMDYENWAVPLVYIQVVTICVYTYFLLCLVDRQWLIRDEKLDGLNLYFPFFTTLQFIFHMGWFKVAESLINPFGGDDDDFELDQILQRHIEISKLMMDSKEDYSIKSLICYDSVESKNGVQNKIDCLSFPLHNCADQVMGLDSNEGFKESQDSMNNHARQLTRLLSEDLESVCCNNIEEDIL